MDLWRRWQVGDSLRLGNFLRHDRGDRWLTYFRAKRRDRNPLDFEGPIPRDDAELERIVADMRNVLWVAMPIENRGTARRNLNRIRPYNQRQSLRFVFVQDLAMIGIRTYAAPLAFEQPDSGDEPIAGFGIEMELKLVPDDGKRKAQHALGRLSYDDRIDLIFSGQLEGKSDGGRMAPTDV